MKACAVSATLGLVEADVVAFWNSAVVCSAHIDIEAATDCRRTPSRRAASVTVILLSASSSKAGHHHGQSARKTSTRSGLRFSNLAFLNRPSSIILSADNACLGQCRLLVANSVAKTSRMDFTEPDGRWRNPNRYASSVC